MPTGMISAALYPAGATQFLMWILLSTHFTRFFDVWIQLSHSGYKLRLELVDLHVSKDVVYETRDG